MFSRIVTFGLRTGKGDSQHSGTLYPQQVPGSCCCYSIYQWDISSWWKRSLLQEQSLYRKGRGYPVFSLDISIPPATPCSVLTHHPSWGWQGTRDSSTVRQAGRSGCPEQGCWHAPLCLLQQGWSAKVTKLTEKCRHVIFASRTSCQTLLFLFFFKLFT